VLAGDHQQLAACVKSREAQQRGLDRTLFERLVEQHGDDISSLLSTQYRMNSLIMGWSSHRFYGTRLVAAESVANQTLQLSENTMEQLTGSILDIMSAPLLFVDTASLAAYREVNDGAVDAQVKREGSVAHQSHANQGESRFVVHYAKMLVRCGIKPSDMTVIAPYTLQVERLKSDFAEDSDAAHLGLEKPRVNTVDSFQGQEADVVLISLVRSNDRGVVGFLSDYRRLNVAVTRARKHVMLVGDSATISNDAMLASLYEYAAEQTHVVYVQQLLDDEGHVPSNPDSVPEPQIVRQQKAPVSHKAPLEEQMVRSRFEEKLSSLCQSGGRLELPPSLNSFERAIAHEVADSLGLLHESRGEGAKRRLIVWSKGSAETTVETGTPVLVAAESSESEGETPLLAFERRAKAEIGRLSAAVPLIRWKTPSAEQQEILLRLAADAALELHTAGAGKKRTSWIEFGNSEVSGDVISITGGPTAVASATKTVNAALGDLHAERLRRQAEAAAKAETERRQQIAAAKMELNRAKKQQKGSTTIASGEDDFDALLDDFVAKDSVCAFGVCNEKINTLMDMIAKCRHCQSRYCLKHVQAECHGCGDAASRDEKKKFREHCDKQVNSRGNGLASKGVAKPVAELKLHEKLKDQKAARTAKKKPK